MMTGPIDRSTSIDEFSGYIGLEFDPISHSHDLILSVNGLDNTELDLVTPIKKLSFEIDELEKRMTLVTTQNHEAIALKLKELDVLRNLIFATISPLMDRVFSSYDRLKLQVVDPYQEASDLHAALRRIHATLSLLRESSLIIFLIQQIQKHEVFLAGLADDQEHDTVRLAKLYLQASDFYAKQEINRDVDVFAISLIRDYRPVLEASKHQLIEKCNKYIALSFSRHASLVPSNSQLRDQLITLYVLDKDSFHKSFKKNAINKPVQVSLAQLSRGLQSPRNFATILNQVEKDFTDYCDKLERVCINCMILATHPEAKTLSSIVLENLNAPSFRFMLFSQLATLFGANIESTLLKGGPVAKNLRVYHQGLQNTVTQIFQDPEEQRLMREALDKLSDKR